MFNSHLEFKERVTRLQKIFPFYAEKHFKLLQEDQCVYMCSCIKLMCVCYR